MYYNSKSNQTLTVHSEGNLYSSESKKKRVATLHEELGESKEITLESAQELVHQSSWIKQTLSWITITIED